MIVLYEHPLSPYAQKVKIALRAKGVDFEARLPKGLGSGAAADDFAAGNPRREVPLLIDGDQRIFDSTVILDYVEERWPEPALMPAAPAARAGTRMIEEVMDTHYEAINWGLSELRNFRRAEGEKLERMTARAGEQIAGAHRWLAQRLGDAPWFGGAAFGRADLAVVPFLNGSAGFGFAPPAGSALAAWLARVNEVPAVAETAAEAAPAAEAMKGAWRALEAGGFRRQYRDHRLEWMMRSGGVDVVLDGLDRDNIRLAGDLDGAG